MLLWVGGQREESCPGGGGVLASRDVQVEGGGIQTHVVGMCEKGEDTSRDLLTHM